MRRSLKIDHFCFIKGTTPYKAVNHEVKVKEFFSVPGGVFGYIMLGPYFIGQSVLNGDMVNITLFTFTF